MYLDQISLNIIISCLGVVISLGSIWLVYRTLKEMEKQREEAYKPALIIPRFCVHSLGNNYKKSTIFNDLSRGDIYDDEISKYIYRTNEESTLEEGSNYIVLYNLGLGAAKDISINWQFGFDIFKIIQEINILYVQNSIPIIIEIDNEAITICDNRTQPSSNYRYIVKIPKTTIDFLLPQSIDFRGIRLSFPIIYERIITLLASCYSQPTLKKIPIFIDISYRDISNRRYKQRLKFTMIHNLLIIKAVDETKHFYAYYEAT